MTTTHNDLFASDRDDEPPAPQEKRKKRKRGKVASVLGVVLFVGGAGVGGYSLYKGVNSDETEEPAVSETFSADVSELEAEGASIPGADPGDPYGDDDGDDILNKDDPDYLGSGGEGVGDISALAGATGSDAAQVLGYDLADGYQLTGETVAGVPQVAGSDASIPAFGNIEDGQAGRLTENAGTVSRGTSGDPISAQMAAKCPGITNGSICFPGTSYVLPYHVVGTHQSDTGSAMDVPSTISAGWLKDTAKIGSSQGTSLFAAHVMFSGGSPGPFWDVPSLESGDEIIIRDLSGHNHTYRVYKKTVHEWTELPSEVFETTGRSQIALVTCTGTYSGGTFDKRTIAWAVPV